MDALVSLGGCPVPHHGLKRCCCAPRLTSQRRVEQLDAPCIAHLAVTGYEVRVPCVHTCAACGGGGGEGGQNRKTITHPNLSSLPPAHGWVVYNPPPLPRTPSPPLPAPPAPPHTPNSNPAPPQHSRPPARLQPSCELDEQLTALAHRHRRTFFARVAVPRQSPLQAQLRVTGLPGEA